MKLEPASSLFFNIVHAVMGLYKLWRWSYYFSLSVTQNSVAFDIQAAYDIADLALQLLTSAYMWLYRDNLAQYRDCVLSSIFLYRVDVVQLLKALGLEPLCDARNV
jgi:hypothetical protein